MMIFSAIGISNFSIESMSMDFELGAINSFREVFNGTRMDGCFFHFSQNLFKRVKKYGLVGFYNKDELFRKA